MAWSTRQGPAVSINAAAFLFVLYRGRAYICSSCHHLLGANAEDGYCVHHGRVCTFCRDRVCCGGLSTTRADPAPAAPRPAPPW